MKLKTVYFPGLKKNSRTKSKVFANGKAIQSLVQPSKVQRLIRHSKACWISHRVVHDLPQDDAFSIPGQGSIWNSLAGGLSTIRHSDLLK